MSEFLDQNDIDALLASVGGDAPPAAPAASAPTAAPAASKPTIVIEPPPPPPDATPYDFRRPKRVSTEQVRALSAIHEAFSRNFGATLSSFLRSIVDVRVVAVEQVLYNEFIQSLPNPTCFIIVQATPLEGQLFLEISPLIVFPIIDRLLGGTGGNMTIPQRPLTSIEWRLITRIVERGLEDLSQAWRNLIEARFEIAETEGNPHMVNIVAPSEVVVFITFEIRLGNAAGTMGMCIPFNVFESVMGKLTNQAWLVYRAKGASTAQQDRLLRSLSRSVVRMTAYLGETRIRMSELRGLQKGDILQLGKRQTRDMILQVADRNKFAGSIGQVRGHKALRITRRAEIDEPL